jgi:hypothetical protein
MLTNDATNRLDAINDVMALVTLMDELIGARKPGSQIDLSDTAASGLSLVLGHVVEVLGDAATGLHKAQAEIAAAGSDYSNETYRRGYRHGYVDAVKEEGRADAPDTPHAPDVAPTPVLTESVPQQEREQAIPDEQRQRA